MTASTVPPMIIFPEGDKNFHCGQKLTCCPSWSAFISFEDSTRCQSIHVEPVHEYYLPLRSERKLITDRTCDELGEGVPYNCVHCLIHSLKLHEWWSSSTAGGKFITYVYDQIFGNLKKRFKILQYYLFIFQTKSIVVPKCVLSFISQYHWSDSFS